jgi:hypothetical protein
MKGIKYLGENKFENKSFSGLTKIGDEKLKIILCGLIKLITNLHVH